MADESSITISVRQVSKTIAEAQVLDDISMNLQGGNSYGLQGPNGSGKTMLMRAICGLIHPTKGEVVIDGKTLGKDISLPPSVGALIENPAFLDGRTALQNLELLARIRNLITVDDICRTLTSIGLDPHDRRPYRKFSLGMRQRLGIAAALMEDPRLIVVDEPGNGLDSEGVALLRDLLDQRRARGALVLIASHNKDELEFLSNEVFSISQGRIVDHTTFDEGHQDKPRRMAL